METGMQFPKFKCLITNDMEDYDSGVWEFFRHFDVIMCDLGQLIHLDSEWKENYTKIIRYFSDLGSSIIMKRDAPDGGFLNQYISDQIESTDVEDVLFRAKSNLAGFQIRIGADLERLMGEYIRLSRIPRFSGSFETKKIEGLRSLAKVAYSRGIEISKQ